jgi:nitrite reductase (NO-forming)
MKKTLLLLFVLALISGSTYAMLDNSKSTTTNKSTISIPDEDPAAAKYPNGAKIYKAKCVACHQLTGEGVPGAFPPLKNSDYLFADTKRAVKQVLNGSNEPMIVNGVTYVIPMPFQVDTQQDAVDVINYILNAWGNDGGTVKLEDVKDIKIVR